LNRLGLLACSAALSGGAACDDGCAA